jgi:hypothetical protein
MFWSPAMNIKRYIDIAVRKAIRRAFADKDNAEQLILEAENLYDRATSFQKKRPEFKGVYSFRRLIKIAIASLKKAILKVLNQD